MQKKILFLKMNESCSSPAYFETFLHFDTNFCN